MRPIDLARLEYDDDSPRHLLTTSPSSRRRVTSIPVMIVSSWPDQSQGVTTGSPLNKGFTFKNPDTWFVYLGAGEGALHRFIDLAPFKTEWVCWHRRKDNELRYHTWKFYERKVKKWEAQK